MMGRGGGGGRERLSAPSPDHWSGHELGHSTHYFYQITHSSLCAIIRHVSYKNARNGLGITHLSDKKKLICRRWNGLYYWSRDHQHSAMGRIHLSLTKYSVEHGTGSLARISEGISWKNDSDFPSYLVMFRGWCH